MIPTSPKLPDLKRSSVHVSVCLKCDVKFKLLGFSSVRTHHVGRKWVQMLSVSLFIWKLLRMQSRAELWGWRYPEMMQSSLNTWGPNSTPDERSTHPSNTCQHYKKNQNRINVASQWSVESSSRTLNPSLLHIWASASPWAPGGCPRAAAAWGWACLWAVWWHPSLSGTLPRAWPVLHGSGPTTPDSWRCGPQPSVHHRPISGSVSIPGSSHLWAHRRPRSPATLETLRETMTLKCSSKNLQVSHASDARQA